jgi:hypothetical protein
MSKDHHIEVIDEHEGLDPRLKQFYYNLIEIGIFPRAYDPKSKALLDAAKAIWNHLCTLDNNNYKPTKSVMLYEFANCYAKLFEGRKMLKGNKEEIKTTIDNFKGA